MTSGSQLHPSGGDAGLSHELGGTLECFFVMSILCHIVHQVLPASEDAKQSFFISDENNLAIVLFQRENTFLMLNHLLPID